MIVSFDEDVQERDCTVLFELNGKFDICVTVIEVVQRKVKAVVINGSIVTLSHPRLV